MQLCDAVTHFYKTIIGVTVFHKHADRHTSLFFNREQTAEIGFYKTDPVSVDPVLKRENSLKPTC